MNFVRLSHDRVTFDVDHDVSTASLHQTMMKTSSIAVETSRSTSIETLRETNEQSSSLILQHDGR